MVLSTGANKGYASLLKNDTAIEARSCIITRPKQRCSTFISNSSLSFML